MSRCKINGNQQEIREYSSCCGVSYAGFPNFLRQSKAKLLATGIQPQFAGLVYGIYNNSPQHMRTHAAFFSELTFYEPGGMSLLTAEG